MQFKDLSSNQERRIIYEFQLLIDKTLGYYWKLRGLESIEMFASPSSELPNREMRRLINVLIDNDEIKDILTKSIAVRSTHRTSLISQSTSKTL